MALCQYCLDDTEVFFMPHSFCAGAMCVGVCVCVCVSSVVSGASNHAWLRTLRAESLPCGSSLRCDSVHFWEHGGVGMSSAPLCRSVSVEWLQLVAVAVLGLERQWLQLAAAVARGLEIRWISSGRFSCLPGRLLLLS